MPKSDRLPPGAVKLLKEPQLGHVVTLMPDGSPQITVVWIDAEDDGSHVLVNTGTKRQKLRNVGRDKRVAVSVVDSPGHRLTSLSLHRTGSTGVPAGSTRCASTKNAGVFPVPLLVNVTVVVVVPSAPLVLPAFETPTDADARPDSPDRSA